MKHKVKASSYCRDNILCHIYSDQEPLYEI